MIYAILHDTSNDMAQGFPPQVLCTDETTYHNDANFLHFSSSQHSVDLFKENIKNLMKRFNESIPEECLVIWLTCPPIKGGVQMGKTAQNKPKSAASLGKKVVQVYPELEFLQVQRRLEIMAANMYARQVVVEYGYDVLDMHYFFRRHLHRRIFDGIHWDMTGHRRISNLILTHIAEAWGETLPNRVSANSAKILKPLSAVEVSTPKPPVPVQKRQIKKANKRIKAKNRQPTKVQPVRPQKQFHASPGNFSQNCNWTSDNIDFTDDSIPMSNYFCNNTPNYSGFDNYRHQQQSPRMGYQNNAMRPSGQYQGPSGQWGAGYNTDQVNNHVLGLVANIFQSFASGGMGNSRGRPRGPGPQNQNNRYQPYY